MNPRSLRFRLIVWFAGLLTGAFLLFSVALYQVLQGYLAANLTQTLFRRSAQITGLLMAGMDQTKERGVADEIATRYAPENYDRFVRLTRPDGSILYASGRAAGFDPSGMPPLKVSEVKGDFTYQARLGDGNLIMVTVKEFHSSDGHRYLIESGGPMAPIETLLTHLRLSLLIGVPLLVLVAVGGGFVLVSRALAPVVKIAESAEQITLHNLNERLPLTKTGDELEHLSLALNRMIARLSESFEQNRRFLADASHELRTPLAAWRGEMESVVEQTRGLPELRDRAGSALEEVDRLAKIVDALFAISRLDAGEAQQEWARFDLAPLAASTAEQMSLLAEDKGVSIDCHVQDHVCVEGDQARIKQVVVNLLDNAIKYTPAGGAIHLNVRADGGKAILEVVDTGIGIPAEALPHVFERFFRVDRARSREIGGAGLGLAIVKSICTAHGGQVEAQSDASHGSRFIVELPLGQPVRAKAPL
ncbi:MAG TPA: ATP-binding protein [Candidatus Cybelea sp.]|nr:ATP-binding protein [Candidatus Cybelea sp.]